MHFCIKDTTCQLIKECFNTERIPWRIKKYLFDKEVKACKQNDKVIIIKIMGIT